eukprot:COSAG06_NODE_1889_length_8134_cov_3.277785_7_plen_105_part_00
MIIYQDRLGTNEGKALKKRRLIFAGASIAGREWTLVGTEGAKNAFYTRFTFFKNGRFAKTGLDKSRTSEGKEAFCAGGYVLDGPNTLWSPAYPMVRKIALLRCH